jgi:hypothetical protein
MVLLVVVGVCPAFGQLPSGYWADGRTVAKVQQRVWGLTHWSSILLAQIHQESGWRRCPSSRVGARGLTQFMPSTQAAVERQIGVHGDICDPSHAALLQAHLMRDNARNYSIHFRGFRPQWSAALMTYNGSPRNFMRQYVAAGRPCCSTVPVKAECWRFRSPANCRENNTYDDRIFYYWPRYLEMWRR